MKKHELIELTLEQLIESFKTSPESFEYEDQDYSPHKMCANPTIIWQPKFELRDNQGSIVTDPHQKEKTVIVSFNPNTGEMSCYIFNKAVNNLSSFAGIAADAAILSVRNFSKWRSDYRKFSKLSRLIKAKDRTKESDKFLRKLCSVFPGTLDKHILG
jgi:hypothetical protein